MSEGPQSAFARKYEAWAFRDIKRDSMKIFRRQLMEKMSPPNCLTLNAQWLCLWGNISINCVPFAKSTRCRASFNVHYHYANRSMRLDDLSNSNLFLAWRMASTTRGCSNQRKRQWQRQEKIHAINWKLTIQFGHHARAGFDATNHSVL